MTELSPALTNLSTISAASVTAVAASPTIVSSVRASPPTSVVHEQLGPLANLPGTWIGRGFNIVALPTRGQPLPFRLKVDSTVETLTFTTTGAPIPNRGGTNQDISFVGLHYFQQVVRAEDSTGLHLETGMWLNLPDSESPTITRMSTIPHGDALLAQGSPATFKGAPPIPVVDVMPFTLDPATGARHNDTNPVYLAPYHSTAVPAGLPAGSILDPNLVLKAAIQGKTIVGGTVLNVNATPVGGINGTTIKPPSTVGGIVNIPFVKRNADANSLSAFFWIEEIESAGQSFLQLQYSQITILEFAGLKWPHVSVATLIRQ